MTEDSIIFYFALSNPLFVSPSADLRFSDFVQVSLKSSAIKTKINKVYVPFENFTIGIPIQKSGKKSEKSILAVTEQILTIGTTTSAFVMVAMFFVSFAMANVLSDISLLQTIVNFTCMIFSYPALLSEFNAQINTFVTFDILPTDKIYEATLGPENSIALTENFDFAGYSSGEFIRIFGSVFIFTSVKILWLLTCKATFAIKKRFPTCKIPTKFMHTCRSHLRNLFGMVSFASFHKTTCCFLLQV